MINRTISWYAQCRFEPLSIRSPFVRLWTEIYTTVIEIKSAFLLPPTKNIIRKPIIMLQAFIISLGFSLVIRLATPLETSGAFFMEIYLTILLDISQEVLSEISSSFPVELAISLKIL